MTPPGLSLPSTAPRSPDARHQDERTCPTTPHSSALKHDTPPLTDAETVSCGVSFVILRPRQLDGEDDCESEPATPRPLYGMDEIMGTGSTAEDVCNDDADDRASQDNQARTETVSGLRAGDSSDDGETVTQRGHGLLARAAAALCSRFPVPPVGFTSGSTSTGEGASVCGVRGAAQNDAKPPTQGEAQNKSAEGLPPASFVSRGIAQAVPVPTSTNTTAHATMAATTHARTSGLPRPTAPVRTTAPATSNAKPAARTIAADSSPAFLRRRAKIAALERAQAEEDARDVAALCADVRSGGGARDEGRCAMTDRGATSAGGPSASGVWSSGGGDTGVSVRVETTTTTASTPSLQPVALAETFAHVRFAPADLDGLGARWRECAELRAWAARARRQVVEKEWAGIVQAKKARDAVREREEKARCVTLERAQAAEIEGAEVSAPGGNERRTPLPVMSRGDTTADAADARSRGRGAVAAGQPSRENSPVGGHELAGAKTQERPRADDGGDDTLAFPAPPPMVRTSLPPPLLAMERTRARPPSVRAAMNRDDGDRDGSGDGGDVSLLPAMRRTHVGRLPGVPSMQALMQMHRERGRAPPGLQADHTHTHTQIQGAVRQEGGEGTRVVRCASADESGCEDEEDGGVRDVRDAEKTGVRAEDETVRTKEMIESAGADDEDEDERARKQERELLARAARRGMGARTRTMVRVPPAAAVQHERGEETPEDERTRAASNVDVNARQTSPTAVLAAPEDKTTAVPPLPTRSPARLRANISLPHATTAPTSVPAPVCPTSPLLAAAAAGPGTLGTFPLRRHPARPRRRASVECLAALVHAHGHGHGVWPGSPLLSKMRKAAALVPVTVDVDASCAAAAVSVARLDLDTDMDTVTDLDLSSVVPSLGAVSAG